jgi:hypothetical protein
VTKRGDQAGYSQRRLTYKGGLRSMKTIMLILCLSMIASAQVLVNQSVNENPATGVKIVTVLLTVKGDKPYSGDPSAPPAELGIM